MRAFRDLPIARAISRIGVYFAEPTMHENQIWLGFARSLPPARFVIWLANQVAVDLLTASLRSPRDARACRFCSMAMFCPSAAQRSRDLMAGVEQNESGRFQADAERFLRHRFLLLPCRTAPPRLIIVFRHAICHRLRII